MTRRGARAICALNTILISISVLVGGGPSTANGEEAKNVLPNAAFEQRDGDQVASWRTRNWGGDDATFTWDESGRTGRSLRIAAEGQGADASWYAVVPVDPHATYRLSAWIKTENVEPTTGRGALLNLHNIQSARTDAVSGTEDWTEVSVVFESGASDEVWVNCLFGGWGLATGTAWFDDIRLERIAMEEWKPEIKIDASETFEPMPVYIYGQFIEHLGRCIDGGIWAEMIQDRKFYYPITADYDPYGGARPSEDNQFPVLKASPWKYLGPSRIVMEKDGAFVGEHTPVMRGSKATAVEQAGLGVVEGKRYVGYAWLRADGDVEAVISLACPHPTAKGLISSEPGCHRFDVAREYTKYPFEFTATATTNDAVFNIAGSGEGKLYIGAVSLMPADNIEGFRADTLALLKELNSPVYRWPGGNFVSGYNWKDGIGPRDRRPPRKNPAWTGVESNDMGLDEFMTFCKLLDTEPYIAVNSGLGGVESAVEELQYANGAADTPMGRLRAENGHPEPYKVKW